MAASLFFFFFEAVNNVQRCEEKAELHCALSYRTNAGLRHLKTEFSVAERILKLFKLRAEAKNEHLSSQRHRDPLKCSFWPESWFNIVILQPDKQIKVFIEGILMLTGQCSLLHTDFTVQMKEREIHLVSSLITHPLHFALKVTQFQIKPSLLEITGLSEALGWSSPSLRHDFYISCVPEWCFVFYPGIWWKNDIQLQNIGTKEEEKENTAHCSSVVTM